LEKYALGFEFLELGIERGFIFLGSGDEIASGGLGGEGGFVFGGEGFSLGDLGGVEFATDGGELGMEFFGFALGGLGGVTFATESFRFASGGLELTGLGGFSSGFFEFATESCDF
jgi:hypothetical protein